MELARRGFRVMMELTPVNKAISYCCDRGTNLLGRRCRILATAAVTAVLTCLLSACQVVGPIALGHGRPDYNDVIQHTSAEQVLQNVVRVWFDEPTLFLDVSEVDAQLTFNSQLMGGGGGIGGSATGNVSATLQYAEQPTIRYVPLQGQALIQQITTPIDVDSLAKLFDSDWPLIAVLDLATDRLAPRYEDSYSALNAIADLDQYGALVVTAGKSPLSSKKETAEPTPLPKGARSSPIFIQTGGGGDQGANDALVLFFEPDRVSVGPIVGSVVSNPPGRSIRFNDYRPTGDDVCLEPPPDASAQRIAAKKNVLHLWVQLLGIYQGTQPLGGAHAELPKYPTPDDLGHYERKIDAAATLGELERIAEGLPRWIELTISPITVGEHRSRAPVLRTRSALGILKAATAAPAPSIQFLKRDDAERLRAEPRNNPELRTPFFVLDGEADNETARWAKATHCYLYTRWLGPEDYSKARSEHDLGYLRSYILVETSKEPPPDPYVSVRGQDGQWYSIRKGDKISQANFALIAQLLTMQAVPSQTPPLTPTIPVAGRGP